MGDTALVIGATGGLGREFCKALKREGADVIVAGRSAGPLLSLVEAGVADRSIACDLSLPGAAERLACVATDVSLLIFAAGIASSVPFAERSWESIHDEIAVNALSVTQVVHAFGRRMLAAHRGCILLIGSTAASRPAPGIATYAASKAFLAELSSSLAAEWAPQGVRISCCIAGPMATDFAQRSGLPAKRRARDPARVATAMLAQGRRSNAGVTYSDPGAWLRTRFFRWAPQALLARLAVPAETRPR